MEAVEFAALGGDVPVVGARASGCRTGRFFTLRNSRGPGLSAVTSQTPTDAVLTKLSPPVIWGQEDQTLHSHRSRRCVRVCDGTGKSGTDER